MRAGPLTPFYPASPFLKRLYVLTKVIWSITPYYFSVDVLNFIKTVSICTRFPIKTDSLLSAQFSVFTYHLPSASAVYAHINRLARAPLFPLTPRTSALIFSRRSRITNLNSFFWVGGGHCVGAEVRTAHIVEKTEEECERAALTKLHDAARLLFGGQGALTVAGGE